METVKFHFYLSELLSVFFDLGPLLPLANNSILFLHNLGHQNYYVSLSIFLHMRSIINAHAHKAFFFLIPVYKNVINFWKLFSLFSTA